MPEAVSPAPPIGLSGPNQQVDNSVTAAVPKPLLKTVAAVVPPEPVVHAKHHVSKQLEKQEKARVARLAAAPAPTPVDSTTPVVTATSTTPVVTKVEVVHEPVARRDERRDASWSTQTPDKK